ncbi:PREDICTED: uncharacterized protein LOC109162216 [Ipomoea nil]|uniref:uncharacterized protein LOC109162216 n=1 Tax=Ipomoea nil TaxID=35883 RepID=UPI000900E087|nr:PREDICTED: uncharacterized protein LOC109162216 [Ipomoea nil]
MSTQAKKIATSSPSSIFQFLQPVNLSKMSSLFSTSLISHLKLLRSFTRSHPLYFSFSIFFFLKLLSLLSPLSIAAASLLLLALLALSPAVTIRDKFPAESDKVSALISVSFDDESESDNEDELFDLGNFEENRILLEESLIRVGFMEGKSVDSAMEEGRLEDKNAANDGKFEGCGAKTDEFVGTRNGSKAADGNHDNGGGGNAERRRTLEYNRKEREWKRTLACKLYEERNQSGEGMDLLWETYEMETMKNEERQGDDSKEKYEKDSEEEEEEEMDEKLCCLQALKLSAGKMNSGIGRPNLMKISKAIKRFGWLKNVSKKVHRGDMHIQKKVSNTS